MLMNISEYLSKKPKSFLIALGVLLVVFIGVIDYSTGYEISFSIFYMLPITLIAWFVGRLPAVFISILSAITWLLADLKSGHSYSYYAIPFWNSIMRLVIFLMVSYFLTIIKKLYDELEIRVQERTEALKKEKTFTENALNTLKDIFFVFDLEGRFLRWNKTMNMVSGYSDKEISSMKPTGFFLEEDINRVAKAIEMAVKKGSARIEATVLTKDGRQIPYEFTGALLEDHKGRLIGISGVGRDITERKRAEEAVQESEKKYRNLADNALVGIYKTNLKGDILYANVALTKILEFQSKEEMMAESVLARYKNPKDRDILVENLKKMVGVKSFETELLTKTGKVKNILLSATLEGDVISGIILDITERKKAEEALQKSENKYKTLVENLQQKIFLKDINSVYISCNENYASDLRIKPDEITGKTDYDFFPKELAEKYRADDKRIMESVNAEEIEEKYIQDGKEMFVQTVKTPVKDEKGSIFGILGIFWDITERKKAEEQIKRQIERFAALHNIDMAITASLDLRVTLNVFLEHVISQLHVDAATVLLLNPHTQTLEYGSGQGFHSNALKHTHLRLGEGHAGRAALERHMVSISNLAEVNNEFSRSALLATEGFISYYSVPLMAKGHIKGALEIFHRTVLEPDQEWLDFLEALATQAAIAIDNASLFDDLQRSNIELILAYDSTLEGWSKALDLRDKETEGHSQRVTEMTLKIARAMEISDTELVHVRRGALLHDIGKMGIPDNILLKPGPLNDEEWKIMRKHPVYAYEMLLTITFLRPALDIPYYHHEKWDGTGYPRGLKGEQIPLSARIFALVDVWDALNSERPYRPAWPEKKVKEYIIDQAGKHFDPKVVEVFFGMEL